ncbi:MAG: pyridoxamine 5'-phosphate oxidase family protein [Bacillota bacterium]
MKAAVKSTIWELRNTSDIAYLASVDGDGYPILRAMLVLEHGSLRTQYYSTNTSSDKVQAFQDNPKASVYYCKPESFIGALFTGDVEVCTDQPTKDFLWREGFEKYYPRGVTDPDYCVLKFAAKTIRYYGPGAAQFSIDEALDE